MLILLLLKSLQSMSAVNHIKVVSSFDDLVLTPFQYSINAICWQRDLKGDFAEIVSKLNAQDNITIIDACDLESLELSDAGALARERIVKDLQLLREEGADPVLNLIKNYQKDTKVPFFPTDVYSFHVDRAPLPIATYLCTYYGASSEIIANEDALRKIDIPEIRAELRKNFSGTESEFEAYLVEHFFDLHYQPKPEATPTVLGQGHIWRLAVDCEGSNVLPCVHRAPFEKEGEFRLLLIC